jgi:tRNA threonylcarbamoyladenosine biosynthesis protein TsaE
MEKIVTSTKETQQLARQIAQNLESGDVLALSGDLGTGKTTFTRYVAEALGFDGRVQSPTFVLVRNYEIGEKGPIHRINHIDFYRLKTSNSLQELDLDDLLNPKNGITIIEWPEIARDYLPQKTLHINFTDLGQEKRKIDVQNLH